MTPYTHITSPLLALLYRRHYADINKMIISLIYLNTPIIYYNAFIDTFIATAPISPSAYTWCYLYYGNAITSSEIILHKQ
jgi:hypothetical protein